MKTLVIILLLFAVPALACNPAPGPDPGPAPAPAPSIGPDNDFGHGYSELPDVKPDCLDWRNQNDPWCQRRDK